MKGTVMEGEVIRSTTANGAGNGSATAPLPKENWKRGIIALLAILYILSPLDLIPDIFPIIGWLDDLGVLAWAARYVLKK
jgi:uncharacterized membrane protein YkvA (DUF1232 family)